MKKYKLIKEYPGSYKLNTIMVQDSKCTNFYHIEGEDWLVCSAQIENQPCYWQEIIEHPKYVKLLCTILGVIKNDIAKVIEVETNGYILFVPNRKIKSDLAPNVWISKSHTVPSTKEEYDNQFKEKYPTCLDEWLEYVKAKNPTENEISVIIGNSSYDNIYFKLPGILMKDKAKLLYNKWNKKPLFTTEDSVDIYDGDKYWYLDTESFTILISKAYNSSGYKDVIKRFSTEKAAKDYVLKHKPVLSLTDVVALVESRAGEFMAEFICDNSFVEIVRKKVNDC